MPALAHFDKGLLAIVCPFDFASFKDCFRFVIGDLHGGTVVRSGRD